MSCDLSDVLAIPADLQEALKSCEGLFRSSEFLEGLLSHNRVHEIAQALDDVCVRNGVVGYHYTRAIPGSIEANGLRTGVGDEQRSRFLSEHGHRFTSAQRERITDMWATYFTPRQCIPRDNRIWFAMTRYDPTYGGVKCLLTCFGGENVYMPLVDDPEIGSVLRSIGRPLIIRCRLSTDKLRTYSSTPWGRVWLSTYHRSVLAEANRFDVDAYSETCIPVDDVLSVEDVGE